jgi:hypothetical protein
VLSFGSFARGSLMLSSARVMTPSQRLSDRLLLVAFAVAAVWTSAGVPILFGFPSLLVGTSFVSHLVMHSWKPRADVPVPLWVTLFVMLVSRHSFYGDAGETVSGMIHVATVGGLSIRAGQWLAERVRPSESSETVRGRT